MVFESQEINNPSGYRGYSGERSFGGSISLFSSLLLASGISVLRGNGCNHTVQWCSNLETVPELRGFVSFDRKVGGFMLTISGLKNFYYLPHFHDMRYGYSCILEIIRMSYHRDPYKGDVYFFMSKNERSVRIYMTRILC